VKPTKAFYFEGYEFDVKAHEARLYYSFDREQRFTHIVNFDFEPVPGYNEQALDRLLRSLWLMAGVSYYKLWLPSEIVVMGSELSVEEAEFFSRTYRLGLGQLCYENGLSLNRVAHFPSGQGSGQAVAGLGDGGDLVALGGGKDSLVSTSILEAANQDFATFSAVYASEAGKALAELGSLVGRPFLPMRRQFDPRMLEINHQGAYNGHVPVTAEIMFIGLVAALLSGRRRVIFSHESSAGEGNVVYEGVEINHQYAKSLEFEQAIRRHVRESVSPDLDVFSLLRPLGELRIAEMFAYEPMQRYAGHFTSCNRSFRHGSDGFTWCGECPKCAFVFLALAPFVTKEKVVGIWGENLLAKDSLGQTYRELLGLTGHKPFECVGEIEECRQAVRMLSASGNYPEVERFGVPAGEYDWRQWHEDVMPAAYRRMLEQYVAGKEVRI
jgi:hypothetical protein